MTSRAAENIVSLSRNREGQLRDYFERLRARYNRPEFIYSDPLCVAYEWSEGSEREAAGLIAAWLSSGRASNIVDSSRRLLGLLTLDGRLSIGESVEGSSMREIRERLQDFKYRWLDSLTLAAALRALGLVTSAHGGAMAALGSFDDPAEETLIPAVRGLSGALESQAWALLEESGAEERNFRALKWLFSDPSRGGTAKRWMMWLRWFVREDEVDPGGHSELGAHRLLVPLDTHIFRISTYLGLSSRKTPNIRAAEEITAALRLLTPADPLRYDFSIARIGILGHCPARVSKRICIPCALFPVCRAAVA